MGGGEYSPKSQSLGKKGVDFFGLFHESPLGHHAGEKQHLQKMRVFRKLVHGGPIYFLGQENNV